MATKRSADALEGEGRRDLNTETKRLRLSPTMDANSNSSNSSNGVVSEDSALRSSPLASECNRKSSASSLPSSGSDADSESYLSSSSEEESSEDEASEDIITVGGPKRPHISKSSALNGAQDLRARKAALLPQLQAANQELVGDNHGWNMEDVEEGEQHIEMDLGLGVLEEQPDDDSGSSDASSEGEDDSISEDSPVGGRNRDEPDTNVMRKLMGQPKASKKPAIEDLG